MTDEKRSERLMAQVFEVMQDFNERTKDLPLAEYATRAYPMSLRSALVEEAKRRYEPGTGPWSKEVGELDQVDLVFFEEMVKPYMIYSDPKGLMSGVIELLVREIRQARGWPTPPDDHPYRTFEEGT